MTDALKKRCTTFVISDFIDEHDYYKAMSIANNKHDVTAIQVYDKRDAQLPNVGLMRVVDLETGRDRWVNTSSTKVRQAYNKWWYERQQVMIERFNKSRVQHSSIATDEDFVKALMALFKKRELR
jgi:predicted methyltransferase